MQSFAVVTIKKVVRDGGEDERRVACEALADAMSDIAPWERTYFAAARTEFGCPEPEGRFRPGTMFTPRGPGLDAKTRNRYGQGLFYPIRHALLGCVRMDVQCRMSQRPREAPGEPRPGLLFRLSASGRERRLVMAQQPLYVRVSLWHIAQSDQPEQAEQRGDVYLTRCWRWIEASVAQEKGILRGGPASNDEVCKLCLANNSARAAPL